MRYTCSTNLKRKLNANWDDFNSGKTKAKTCMMFFWIPLIYSEAFRMDNVSIESIWIIKEEKKGMKNKSQCGRQSGVLVLVSRWDGTESGKPVGGRNPHRCEVSRKQSPGSIVPAGDGCQHRAGKVGYLVVSHQHIILATLPFLLLFLYFLLLLQPHLSFSGWRVTVSCI